MFLRQSKTRWRAFTVKTLNLVQSEPYPIAFGTDEPISLCAPTGAGKVYFLLLSLTIYLFYHLDKCGHVDHPQ